MKKKMCKKLFAMVLAGVMVLSLAACGSSDSSEDTAEETVEEEEEEETAEEAEEETAEAEEEETASVELDELYWFSDVTGWGPETANWTTDESPATIYIEEEIGLTLNIEQPPTDASTKLGLMIATGDLPDLISITDSDLINQLIEADLVWDLESFLEEYDPDSHLLTDFPEDIKEALTDVYGGWYSYPSHMESEDNRENFPPDDEVWEAVVEVGSNMAIMFNKDIMDALGITEEDVQTESGFYEACEIVKNSGYTVDGQSVLPVILQNTSWIGSSLDAAISYTFGVLPVDDEGNYIHTELHPAYYYALKFTNTLVQNGYLDVNTMTIDETAANVYLDAGRVFCWIGNQAQIDKTDTAWISYGPILADNGAMPAIGISKSAGTGWIQTLVSKDCENPEKIAKLLSWASSEEGLLVNYYGIEGEDYTKDENGIVTLTEEGEITYAEVYDSNILMWPFANTSFERHTEPVPESNSNRGIEQQLMTAMGLYEGTYVYDSALIGFESSTIIEPSSDLGIKLSQIDTYLESQKAKIVTASSDEEFETEYQNMIDTLYDYSIDEIDEVYNEVYQQYCEDIGDAIVEHNMDVYYAD